MLSLCWSKVMGILLIVEFPVYFMTDVHINLSIFALCCFHTHAYKQMHTLSGVFLHSEMLNIQLPNNSFISSAMIGGQNSAIVCARASGDRPNGAVWRNTAGQLIPEGYSSASGNLLLYRQIRTNGLKLFRGGVQFTAQHEGVYSCHIEDDDGNSQILLIGIYTPATVQSSGQHNKT